ncbi:MAG: FdhF/YdeP family oxidoreductase [Nitriliruptoraceae bacterium]|nr:FdhF/YdeP family oxidoreductase [Nitriliruptoraceae bacterium]
MGHGPKASNPLRRRVHLPRLRPSQWVSWRPNGIGLQKPNHYKEMLSTIAENRGQLRYATRILTKGACDGCALGVAGLHDWTIDGVHLCTTRLNLLHVNTRPPMADDARAEVEGLRRRSPKELRDLGRLAYPMLRRRGEPGFSRIGWEEAMELAADRVRAALPGRAGFFTTSRGITNEVYYVAGKVARYLGTNDVDNAARICHSPSTGALKETLGVGATTVSYTDVIDSSDLIVLFGSNAANAQPVFLKYLYLAKQRGAKVAVVNPYREPALENYWVPSNVESALFGTRITDEFFEVATGGDTAFITAVLKVLVARGQVDRAFIDAHTGGFDELTAELDRHDLDDLVRWAGSSRADVERFATMYGASKASVLVWSMGITQHTFGTDNVRAIIDLALVRGNIGRPGAGLMPIRGHSGVQGGAEMGAYATAFPGGETIDADSAAALSEAWGFEVPAEPGRSATELIEAAGRDEVDVLWSSGGNFLDTLPDPAEVRRSLEQVGLRVHVDIVASTQMLVDGDEVLLLPAMTRYEQPGGGTETTTERRVIFSPQIRGPRGARNGPGEVRAEWDIYLDLARRVDPDRAHLLGCDDAQAIREEIARVVPAYAGIEDLRETGDQVQWGGERLCDGWQFPTPDGRAHFVAVTPQEATLPAGHLRLSTRRGKQFNSMVWRETDPITGGGRDALLISAADAARFAVGEGDAVTVRSDHGEVAARVKLAAIGEGSAQMFFPEANPLIDPSRRDPVGLVPDYNATVTIARR